MKPRGATAFILLGIICLYQTIAYGNDDLYICGIVKNIDFEKSTVIIDVTSESCPGPMKFKLPATNILHLDDVDQRICFYIDSNGCKSGYIYNITEIVGE